MCAARFTKKTNTEALSDTEFCLKWLKMFWVVLGVKIFILLTKLVMCVSMIADWLQSPAGTRGIYRALHSLDQHTQSGPAHHTGKWMQLSGACFDCRQMCVFGCICECVRSRDRQLLGQFETGYIPAVRSFHGNVFVEWREDAASLLTSLSITIPAEETGPSASCLLRAACSGSW